MSLDRSLKAANSLARHRNVLTRAERISQLQDDDRFEDGQSVYGLPKVANRKVPVGGKSRAEKPAEATPEQATEAADKAAAAGAAKDAAEKK